MTHKILLISGDGIGPEIVGAATAVLHALRERFGLQFESEEALMGGCAYEATGEPLPEVTLKAGRAADAILLGAVGGPQWDQIERAKRPERGLLALRSGLELFCNLRPASLFNALADASALKPEVVGGLDIMIVRELTGDIYFGQPRGIETLADGSRVGRNTMIYSEAEIRRIAHAAFRTAGQRQGRLCSVDKANVLETTELWREVVTEVAKEYPAVSLSHMYVDNAAMQLVRAPKQFDVIVTGNIFGDILSDLASMLTGSIGMLPSASLDANGKGMYEPIHGSAPDIAGRNIANPLATILSVAMMLRYSLNEPTQAARVEQAVARVLEQGYRTADIQSPGTQVVGTVEMGQQVVAALQA
ncbi:MAG: 3-isopropylmalate dehydrogenase [Gammaproteobacteria bacterium]|jgi:3-isopropylmalate dehydrogenase|nr:3-isopropylmalate dehydrogenase [Gammaproteobacteria bacterium]